MALWPRPRRVPCGTGWRRMFGCSKRELDQKLALKARPFSSRVTVPVLRKPGWRAPPAMRWLNAPEFKGPMRSVFEAYQLALRGVLQAHQGRQSSLVNRRAHRASRFIGWRAVSFGGRRCGFARTYQKLHAAFDDKRQKERPPKGDLGNPVN
jgi:hypothetical protein